MVSTWGAVESKMIVKIIDQCSGVKGLEVLKKKRSSLQRLAESDSFIRTDGRNLCDHLLPLPYFADKESKAKESG